MVSLKENVKNTILPFRKPLPNAACDRSGMVYSNELIGSGGYVEVRLLFVYKESIWHPNVLDEFRAYRQGFNPFLFVESQPGIRPELAKVKIQGEVLRNGRSVSVSDKS